MRVSPTILSTLAILVSTIAYAQGGPPPPAKVVTDTATQGMIAPTTVFKGSVTFKEVSQVAAELPGKIASVSFEEGTRLKSGDVMVQLDAALLHADLNAQRAVANQYTAELRQEEERLRRTKKLLDEDVATPQQFDDLHFSVEALSQRARGQQAEIARLEIELEKKTIRAPFDGVVLSRMAEVGAWCTAGQVIGTLALADVFDVTANVPETQLNQLVEGQDVEVRVAGKIFEAPYVPSPPVGDVNTRTFPIKIRVTDQPWLKSGMSADVRLPTGETSQCVFVPRDAVLLDRGQNVVFLVRDGMSARVEVTVLGFENMAAGLAPNGIVAGDTVVVKGQERLRDAQLVEVMQGGE